MAVLSWVVSNVILATLLALAAWVAQRRARPGLAHVLWVLALVKLVTPPLVSVPLGQSPVATPCELGTCGCPPHQRPHDFARDTLPWVLLAVWAVGAGATAWVAWRRWTQFRRLIALATPAPEEWQSLAARLASDLSLRHPPEVLVVPGLLPPLVIPGRNRPRMLLPADLLPQLDEPQREAMLLHEMAHIRRGDHRVRLLELAVRVAYWWLPVVGLIGSQLRACEELCCDATVVGRLPEARRDYARLLLDVIDFATPTCGPATAMSSTAADLETRLRAILDPTPRATRAPLVAAFVVVLACVILPCQLRYSFAARSIPPAVVETEVEDVFMEGCTMPPPRVKPPAWVRSLGCPS
ncbi:MAG TPA: M56 family metallopeptidase [Gemmataceae bacterium]|nr:M56 family metallopeptidase [Gemmataceae bacterium]